jgi:hypothetical protein
MPETINEYLWQKRYDIKVRALTNRIYYQERGRLFEFREGFIKATSIVAGSVALARVAEPEIIQLCAAFITFASTLSLVFGYGQKARDSIKFSAEWALLEREIDQAGERDFTEHQINTWFARANEIEASEPSAHKRLLKRCHQRAVTALGGTMESSKSWLDLYCPVFLVP